MGAGRSEQSVVPAAREGSGFDPAGGPAANAVAAHASRIPSGHPEGYLEAFAQLYTDLAEQIVAKIEGRRASAASMLVPTVDDGVAEMRFIAAAIESSKNDAAWMQLQ